MRRLAKRMIPYPLLFKNELIFAASLGLCFLLIKQVGNLGWFSVYGAGGIILSSSFYYSSTFFKSQDKPEKLYFFAASQLTLMAYFAGIYKALGIIQASSNELIKPTWLDAFYFSVTTWTTLGYGDYLPSDDVKVFAMSQALLGYVFLGLFVGKTLFLLTDRANQNTIH